MSTTDNPQGGALVAQKVRPLVENAQPLFDTDRFEHFQRAATALMHSSLLPESIRGQSAQQCFSNLMLVFDLSDRWKIPALSIAQCIAIVHNKVVYEGKLITAMLQAAMGTQLQFHYTGDRGTLGYRVYVSDQPFDQLTDDQLAALAPGKYPRGWRMIDGAVSDWQTMGKDGRTPNPAWTGASQHNQLAYRGAREWTRLYEPGYLLGVYGEDEIEAIQDRRDERAAQSGAGGSAITAGFTKTAPTPGDVVAGPVIEAEFTDGPVADVTQEGAAATDASPDAVASATTQAQATQAKPKEDAPARRGKPTPSPATVARLAKCEEARLLGVADGRKGQMANPVKSFTDEERQYYANGHAEGAQAREADQAKTSADPAPAEAGVTSEGREGLALDAFEDGHEAGLAGKPLEVPRAWSEFQDDWTAGWHDGAAERLADDGEGDDGEGEDGFAGDGGDDSMLGAIAEAEPELVAQVLEDHGGAGDEVFDAFDAFASGVRNLQSWGDVKQALNGLSRSDAWKQAMGQPGGTRVRQARISAWMRVVELTAAGKESVDPIGDLTAFRCWVETTDDSDAIMGNWQVLVREPIYQALTPDQKAKLEEAIKGRMKELQQPRLGV